MRVIRQVLLHVCNGQKFYDLIMTYSMLDVTKQHDSLNIAVSCDSVFLLLRLLLSCMKPPPAWQRPIETYALLYEGIPYYTIAAASSARRMT